MSQNSNRLASNIKYYTIGVVSTKLLSFIFVPLYSIYILPESLGSYQYITSIVSLIIPLLYQDVSEGMFRFSIMSKGNEMGVINTVSKYCLNLSLIYCVLFGIAAYICKLDYAGWILLTGLSYFAIQYWQYAARALKENKAYTVSSIICSLGVILFNVIFIIFLKWQIRALFLSNIAGCFFAVIYLESRLHLLRASIRAHIDKQVLVAVIKYSIPLAINVISWWLTSSCNNIIVTKILGPEANGILSMALRFGSIFVLLTTIITMAWQEESFRTADDENKDQYFNGVLRHYSRALFSCVFVLMPMTYIIYKYLIFGDYKTGVALTSIMYLNGAYNAIVTHMGSVFLTRGESKVMFWSTLVAGIVSVIGALLLVYPLGLNGVLFGSLLGYVVNLIIRILLLNKRMKLVINYVEFVILNLICVVVGIICIFFESNVYILGVLFTVALLLAYLINRKLCLSVIKKMFRR